METVCTLFSFCVGPAVALDLVIISFFSLDDYLNTKMHIVLDFLSRPPL